MTAPGRPASAMIAPSCSAYSGLAFRTVCGDAALLELLRQRLGHLDGDRAHQHRLALVVALGDLARDRAPLAALGLEDLVVAVGADHRAVRRDLDDRELVDLHELGRLGERRARHAGQLVVHAEVVLERDRRERLVLLADAHALLRLDRLVQALRPAAAVEDAAGELVDDLHLAVDHRVVDVALVQRLGLQRLDQVVDQRAVLGLVEVVDAEEALGLGDAALGDRDALVLLVELVVVLGGELALGLRVHPLRLLARLQPRGELGEALVEVGRLLGRAGDDQRRPRLVDQDVVDLVDDREVVRGERLSVLVVAAAVLDLLLERRGHVVAQVVEPELGVRAVRDVGGVGGPLLLVRLHVLEHADAHAERLVDRAHPVGVAAREVVVDRHDVHALAGERVQDDGQRGGQRLALAGPHLGDRAVVQHHPADHLHVEVAHLHRAAADLAHERERLGEQVEQLVAVARALAQRVGVGPQLVVVEQLELGLPGVDPVDALGVLLQLPGLAHAQGTIEDRHGSSVAAAGMRPRALRRPERRLPRRRPAAARPARPRPAPRAGCAACRDGV